MSTSSLGVMGLGALLIVVGLLNHFAFHANPIAHFSIILGVLGLIVAAAGYMMSRSGSSAS